MRKFNIVLAAAVALSATTFVSTSASAATCGGQAWSWQAFISGGCQKVDNRNPGDGTQARQPRRVASNPSTPPVVTPTDPTDPTDPVDPTDPTDPETPTNPQHPHHPHHGKNTIRGNVSETIYAGAAPGKYKNIDLPAGTYGGKYFAGGKVNGIVKEDGSFVARPVRDRNNNGHHHNHNQNPSQPTGPVGVHNPSEPDTNTGSTPSNNDSSTGASEGSSGSSDNGGGETSSSEGSSSSNDSGSSSNSGGDSSGSSSSSDSSGSSSGGSESSGSAE